MPSNPKPYMEFKTKEDFEKCFDSVYKSGKDSGAREGIEYALSYILDILNKFQNFDPDIIRNADFISSERSKNEFKKQLELREIISKSAVEEYLTKLKAKERKNKND